MSSPPSGLYSTPTIYGNVDFGPTFGRVNRPLNTKRFVVSDGSAVAIQAYDVMVIISGGIGVDIICTLPDVRDWLRYPWGGFDLIIKNQNFDIAVICQPYSGQLIDGLSTLSIGGSQGVGATILSPLNDLSGWMTL